MMSRHIKWINLEGHIIVVGPVTTQFANRLGRCGGVGENYVKKFSMVRREF